MADSAARKSAGGRRGSIVTPRANFVQRLVSKKKVRFTEDGFDLDLAYVTPQLIAMGFPSTGFEGLYRNPATEVKLFLEQRHPGTCKVYNLCQEKLYEASVIGLPAHLLANVAAYDHNPAAMFCVLPFCRNLADWLTANPEHVSAIHCKAGKGRTGMLICAFLVWSGECKTAQEALDLFGRKRTYNNKGVTIPSQRRYVGYLEQLLRANGGVPSLDGDAQAAGAEIIARGHRVDSLSSDPSDGSAARPGTPSAAGPSFALIDEPPLLLVDRIELLNAPEWACVPGTYFTVELVHRVATSAGQKFPLTDAPDWRSWQIYDGRKRGTAAGGAGGAPGKPAVPRGGAGGSSNDLTESSLTIGEKFLSFAPFGKRKSAAKYARGAAFTMQTDAASRPPVAGDVLIAVVTPKGKLCRFWFHTAFVAGGKLALTKPELDKACKEKKALSADFGLEIHFAAADEKAVSRGRTRLESAATKATSGGTTGESSACKVPDEDEDDAEDESTEATPRSPAPPADSERRLSRGAPGSSARDSKAMPSDCIESTPI